jgi:hypothetical protein
MPSIDYTNLSLSEIISGLDALASDTQQVYVNLEERQLNWRPDAARWSVAQCFDHLLTLNSLLVDAAGEALHAGRPRSFWQRVPVLPGLLGKLLIRSVAPAAARQIKAPAAATPARDVAADIVPRFVAQHRDMVAWLQTVDEWHAAQAIMTSPFSRLITYSVLDGCRLVLAHDRRHLEQARRVMSEPGFPGGLPGE